MRIVDQYKPNNVLSTNIEAHGLVRWSVRSNRTHMNKFQDDFLEVSSEQEMPRFQLLLIAPKTVPSDQQYKYLWFVRRYWQAVSNRKHVHPQVFSRIRLLSEDTTCSSNQNNGRRLDVAPQKFKEESK